MNSCCWLDISENTLEIKMKVSFAFRDFKKRMKTQESLQTNHSSTDVYFEYQQQNRKRMKGGEGNGAEQ